MTKKNERKGMGKKKTGVLISIAQALSEMPTDYMGFLSELKTRISHERIKAVLSANAAMVLLYWDIGDIYP